MVFLVWVSNYNIRAAPSSRAAAAASAAAESSRSSGTESIEVDRLTKMADNKELPPLFDNDEAKNDLDLDDDDSDIFASAIQVTPPRGFSFPKLSFQGLFCLGISEQGFGAISFSRLFCCYFWCIEC